MKAYQEFLQRKIAITDQFGFEIEDSEIHPILKPHQRDIVRWCVRGGRRAIFAQFGLGKSVMQLEALRLILKKSGGGQALIVCPLGVRQEFKRDAQMLDIPIEFIRSSKELGNREGIYLTNYESVRERKLDPSRFKAVSLDECAILRGFGGTKTFRSLMAMFEGSSIYRFVASATPSPNEFIELLAYAAFLDVMEVSEAKTRFFKRDSTQADKLTLHKHKEKDFWLWCASWGIFLQKPSDLGYSDDGYELPPIEIRWHEVASDHTNAGSERDGQGRLIRDASINVQNAAREKRDSLPDRITKLMTLRAEDPEAHRLIWHDLEDERRAIEQAIPSCVTVYGSQDLDEREKDLIAFADGRIQEMAGKPSMLGAGGNYQRFCHWAIFFGINFKFYAFIQAVHRIQRFLQTHHVRIDLIYTEAERGVRKELERKWEQHNILVAEMGKVIREYGLATEAMATALQRSIGTERQEESGRRWKAVNNDSVLETQQMAENSVGLILTSVPFSTQYEYSASYNDFGHNEDNDAFFEQMDFLTPELFRILQPGRICAIHVKDRITPMGMTGMGFQTVQPFHCEAITHYTKHGFGYLGMKTIVTDVVRENNQTYRLGWTEQCKDGTKMGVGMPEYLLLFRKPATDRANGYADVPVVKEKPLCDDHGFPAPFDSVLNWKQPMSGTGYSRGRWQFDAHGFSRSSGDRLISSEELTELSKTVHPDKFHKMIYRMWRDRSKHAIYDFEEHVAIAEDLDYMQRLPATFMLLPPHSWHPDIWTDIARMRTLNMLQAQKGKEFHLCPIQFDICERVIEQMSNKGDVVLDPFSGLGSVGYVAVQKERKYIGVELSQSYWKDSVYYLKSAEMKKATPTLFDLMEAETEAEKHLDTDAQCDGALHK